eukprot:Gregarina_sp_Pseudo_9__222@NODE_1143_length_1841_cov_14_137625_g1070_i0_p1_GENE_NODE_1143_length_1841_cov_14_137625_g1070_i0NODE_1143_length_1841_cov_14_137625_g1070_i0_p1_ORF_typecomplete_len563_score96_11RabGAPTBC/PF00566_18/7_3e44Adeno_E3B/PF03376_14/0_18_NODE_1143_length_1841_cov_14_137625_g1070_i01271815
MSERVHLRAAQFTETPRTYPSTARVASNVSPPRRDSAKTRSAPLRVVHADPFEESLPVAAPSEASQGKPPARSETPPEESPSPSRVQHMFGESREIVNTRNFRKWRSMKARNFGDFFRDHQTTFLRRMRRGVPQKYRWDVWKVVTGLEAVLKAKTAECILEFLPLEPAVDSKETLFSSSNSSSSEGLYSHSAGDDSLTSFGHVSRQDLERLAPTMTPIELFNLLSSKPSKFASLIDIDLNRTFPEIPLFDIKVQKSLHAILNAYANFAPHVGYCQGMNFVMGFILLVSDFAPDEESFWFFVILMSKYQLHGFFREGFPLLGLYISTFDEVIEYYASELRQHFAQESVLPPVYLHQWYLTLFVTSLPLGTVVVIWDFLLCTSLSSLVPLTVALLKVLQSFLMRLRFEGIVKFLKSLRLSGDCDEGKIGKMLVKHADFYPMPEKFAAALTNVDFAKLLEEVSRDKHAHRKVRQPAPSLVDFDSILEEGHSNEPNPLNAAMQDQDFEDDDEEDSSVPLKEATQSPAKDKGRHKSGAPTQTENSSSSRAGASLSKRFLPKVIGRKS